MAPSSSETAAPAPVAAIPQPPPPVTPAPPVAVVNLPEFTFQQEKREEVDSILSDPDESEDEIFGAPTGSKQRGSPMFEHAPPAPVPAPMPAVEPATDSGSPFGFDAAPPQPQYVPPPQQQPYQPVPDEPENPFGAYEAAPAPVPQPVSIPVAPYPSTAPVPQPVADAHGFMGFDQMSEAPTTRMPAAAPTFAPQPAVPQQYAAAPAAQLEAEPQPEQKAEPQSPRRSTARAHQRSGPGMGFYILLGYAVLMTAMTLYGFFFRYGKQLDPGHPLSTIPDNFGEFPAAERKKVSKLNRIIDGDLPPEQRVALGKKLEIGQLEIEPLKVETRRLNIHTVDSRGKKGLRVPRGEAVVLTLRIQNTSDDLTIYPLDPAFSRKFHGTTDEAKPGTALVVGKDFFRGSEIVWPPVAGRNAPVREFEEKQENDNKPLAPHESREYVVFTAADSHIANKVLNSNEPMLWRVQVRRGIIDFKEHEVPVTAIIGVEFKATDVNE